MTLGWCVLLLGLAFGVRAAGLEAQGMWRDEVDALNFARAPGAEMLQNFTRPGWNGPLYFLALRGWIALTGQTAFALRFFSVLGGVLSVALAYVLARRVVGRAAALWALPLLSFSPYLVWYAQEVKMYTWVPSLTLLALYALDRACARPRWGWWAATVIATSLAFYSHILAALLIPVEALWFLLHPHRARGAWRGGLAALALLTLPYLPLLRWQAPLLLATRETGYPAYTLGQMALTLLNGWSTGIASWGIHAGVALFASLALLGVLGLRGAARRVLLLLVWLATPLLLLWLVSLRGPIFTDRYLVWCAPAFYLLCGAGLAWVGRRRRLLPLALLGALLVFSGVNLHRQVAVPIKPQFREVAAYLRVHRRPEELLLFQIPHNHYVVDYYLATSLEPWREAPYTNWPGAAGGYLWDETQLDAEMRALLREATGGAGGGCWLIYSEAALWDARELVKAWLERNATLLETQSFHHVTLFHYALPEME